MKKNLCMSILFSFFLSLSPVYAGSFPSFSLSKTEGGSYQSADLNGKVAIVDFWATWCTVCRSSFRFYEELYQKYGSKGFVIVAINTDTESVSTEKIKDFVENTGATFPVLLGGHSLAKQKGVNAMPTSYILDKQGNIVKTYDGFHDNHKADMEDQIKKLLGGN